MDLRESEIQKSQLLSDKQIESFQESTARLNIYEGSVRAGKSFVALIRWIEFCRSGPPGPLIICGRTDKTIKRNIIMPLQRLVGDAVRYSIGKGEVQLYNRLMFVCGANDERASAKIQGSEFAGALIDELSLMPESFFKMLLSRLSIKGAQLFGSTNPDSPYCWLKKDFIDRKHELDCKVFSFTIDDNPSLDEEYKKQLKKEYQGLWYKRYIEGLWVVAEGAVYDFFDEKEHIIDHPPAPAQKYYVGIDYGTQNPCVFVLIGYNSGAYPNMWLEKEYYYDARKTMRQKSDYDYTQDFIKWLGGITPDAIFIDPSASSFKVELRRQGIKNLRDAVNDVVPGIRFQGQLISNGTYKVCSCCTESIKEYSNYVWDEKASRQGDEKPIKKFDHCFTGESLVLTTKGKIQIKNIKKDDYVVTQYGIDKVIGTWKSIEEESIVELKINGLSTYVTPNHKYFTKNRGYIPVNQLTHNDILVTIKPYNEEIWKKKQSFLKEEITLDIQKVPIYPLGRILDAQVEYSIETYENSTMEAYQKDIKSITKMEIPQTMTLRILHVFQKKNMTNSIMMKYQIDQKKDTLDMEKLCANFQKNGMVLKKGESGIVNMLKINGKIENQENAYVNITKKNIKLFTINLNFVQTHVDQQIEEIQKLMISIKNALYAEKNSMLIGIRENSHVQNNVLPQPELKKEIVYNLTTEKYNTYIVNDICVSNCQDAQRYCLFSQFFQKASLSTMTEADADRMEREYRFSGGDYGYQGRR